MSKLTDFVFRGSPPIQIINAFSIGSTPSVFIIDSSGKKFLSGALTANTYKSVLSVTGSGCITFAGVNREDTTSRLVGIKLTIDGVIVFQSVSSAFGSDSYGIYAVGAGGYFNGSVDYAKPASPVYFNSSFSVEVSSSITETDKVSAIVNYEVH